MQGPWKWWTSCSFRRLSARGDGDVAYGCVQASDGHPDIQIREPDMAFIEHAPDDITDLLAGNDFLVATVAELHRYIDELAEDGRRVTDERNRLRRREQDIIDATEPADGGQYRNDIVSAIQRLRSLVDVAKAWGAALAAHRWQDAANSLDNLYGMLGHGSAMTRVADIANKLRSAALAEREACAQSVLEMDGDPVLLREVAAALRARP